MNPAPADTGKQPTAEDHARQEALRARGVLPQHVAIIMDGNGRWAARQGQARVVGHYEGVESVRDIAEASAQLGIRHLTLYTFSTENWYRPLTEVTALMQLLIRTIRRERKTLLENRISLNAIGDLTKLPDACRRELDETIDATSNGDRMVLTLALSYSGRWEIIEAVRTLARRVERGELHADEIDDAAFEACLTTAGMPDPDLLIRTGGEYRVSNYLLWQIAYSEMYITERFWPEFRREQLYEAIRNFQDRDRRFGRV